ncbi:hypothetical protein YB2330_006165 [Saitoella coloradoensis]
MPPGMLRLNARPSDNPNDHITFIKPLPSPQDDAISRDYLCRIAAKIHPIMRDHGMGVMSLDEFPPNKEFWGRNWNAGENIELVLRSHSQSWLPFQHVQNVMLHELAHIKHMNHGPKFWAFLKQLQNEMRELEAKGWEGAGFYGRGNSLSGQVVQGRRELLAAEIPENLCGGTWTRKKRRSTKPRKPRKRKFAGDGSKLGADESKRSRLERGKKVAAKPRVAQSKRGRELRAAAAERRIVIAKLKADMADEKLIKAKEEENRRLTALGEKELQGNDDSTDDAGTGVGSVTEDEDPTEDEGDEVVEVKPEPEDEWGLDAMRREMEEMCGTCGEYPPSLSTIRAASPREEVGAGNDEGKSGSKQGSGSSSGEASARGCDRDSTRERGGAGAGTTRDGAFSISAFLSGNKNGGPPSSDDDDDEPNHIPCSGGSEGPPRKKAKKENTKKEGEEDKEDEEKTKKEKEKAKEDENKNGQDEEMEEHWRNKILNLVVAEGIDEMDDATTEEEVLAGGDDAEDDEDAYGGRPAQVAPAGGEGSIGEGGAGVGVGANEGDGTPVRTVAPGEVVREVPRVATPPVLRFPAAPEPNRDVEEADGGGVRRIGGNAPPREDDEGLATPTTEEMNAFTARHRPGLFGIGTDTIEGAAESSDSAGGSGTPDPNTFTFLNPNPLPFRGHDNLFGRRRGIADSPEPGGRRRFNMEGPEESLPDSRSGREDEDSPLPRIFSGLPSAPSELLHEGDRSSSAICSVCMLYHPPPAPEQRGRCGWPLMDPGLGPRTVYQSPATIYAEDAEARELTRMERGRREVQEPARDAALQAAAQSEPARAVSCPCCTSLNGPPLPVLCEVCGNLLQPEMFVEDEKWKCLCDTVNHVDMGRCGACGKPKE